MARVFNGSSDFLAPTGTPVTGPPFTFACWFRTDKIGIIQNIFDLSDADADQSFFLFLLASPDELRFSVRDGVTSSAQVGTFTIDTWYHACCVEAAVDDHRVYLNGTAGTPNTSSRTPTGIDTINIGRRLNAGAPHRYFDGDLAECRLWDVALTDDEITALASGVHPLRVRPDHSMPYWPIRGLDSPEPDVSEAGYPLTVTGATQSDHPPVGLFTPPWVAASLPIVVAPTGSILIHPGMDGRLNIPRMTGGING